MYYLINEKDTLLEAFIKNEFSNGNQIFVPSAHVQSKAVYTKAYDQKYLLLNTHSGLWCMLNRDEYDFFRVLDGQTLGELTAGQPMAKEFLYHLYLRDMIELDGNGFIDKELFEIGPAVLSGPLFIVVPTERCNFRCKYCFAMSDANQDAVMSEDTAENVIRFIKASGERYGTIEFAGGEALIEFEFIKKFIQRIRECIPQQQMELRFVIQTNATLLDAEKIKFLRENGIRIGISLDGYEQINDAKRVYCNGKGTYKDIVRSLKLLNENGCLNGIVSVVTCDNYDKIIDILEHFKSLGCVGVKLNPVFKIGRADEDWDDLSVSAEDYIKEYSKYIDYVRDNDDPVVENNLTFMVQHMTSLAKPYRCMTSKCGAGTDFYTFAPNGEVNHCSRYRHNPEFCLGNVNSGYLPNGKSSPITEKMAARKVADIPECRQCLYRHFCEGGCSIDSYVHYGNWTSPHPWCKYYKAIYEKLFDVIADDEFFAEKISAVYSFHRALL